MARLNTVTKARKPQGQCQYVGCEVEILAGDPYLWWKPYRSMKRIRCVNHRPSRSEMATSETLSEAYAVADQDVPEFKSVEELDDFVADIVDGIQNIIDIFDEQMSNLEDGFGHTDLPAYEELEERKDLYEDWLREADGWDSSNMVVESEACKTCGLTEGDHIDSFGDEHIFETYEELAVEVAQEEVQELLAGVPE